MVVAFSTFSTLDSNMSSTITSNTPPWFVHVIVTRCSRSSEIGMKSTSTLNKIIKITQTSKLNACCIRFYTFRIVPWSYESGNDFWPMRLSECYIYVYTFAKNLIYSSNTLALGKSLILTVSVNYRAHWCKSGLKANRF